LNINHLAVRLTVLEWTSFCRDCFALSAGFVAGAAARFFAMYRSAFLAAALLSIAQAAKAEAKAESGFASYYGGRGHRGEMTCAHPGLWEASSR
jgi:hypothetical protein